MSEKGSDSDHFKGWLWKWTNYIKGYQRRWFVLSNGLLSYYRSQAEMAHTCRGTINLAGAFIVTEDSCNFMISNGGTQTFHLKASSEVERQRWITALELAKARASRMIDTDDSSDDEGEGGLTRELPGVDMERSELRLTLRTLGSKLDDLATCNELISKHGGALQRALSDLETAEHQASNLTDPTALSAKIKTVNERATLFRITSTAMINACGDFLQLAQAQGKKWHKSIVHEREQRLRLEETVETLAKQHNTLERAIHAGTGPPRHGSEESTSSEMQDSEEEEDDEFVDASDKGFTTEFVKGHRKTSSSTSLVETEALKNGVALSSDLVPSTSGAAGKKVWRTTIPEKPNHSINLWSIMKNCIGRDLSKIPMPVNFNEPLSMLQRLAEDLEYSELLDRAAKCSTSQEQMSYVVAFTISCYASTLYRIGKPFNPLLGETFEMDRRDDLGIRVLCEQVSHHPPSAAIFAESKDKGEKSGWSFWTQITVSSKFRGKYLNVMPGGTLHVMFHESGNHYTWSKPMITVHNIIVGKLWVDQSGDAEVVNHTTGDYCKHKYFPYSYFSRDTPRKVSGIVMDKHDKAHFVISGTWDTHIDSAKIVSVNNANKSKPIYQTLPAKVLWKVRHLPPGAEKIYHFTTLAVSLNEEVNGVAPTDSRLRPDQRMMENGNWDMANELKQSLEDAQRTRRKKREAEATMIRNNGQEPEQYEPTWFTLKSCELTHEMMYTYDGKYWDHRSSQNWAKCPKIFEIPPTAALENNAA